MKRTVIEEGEERGPRDQRVEHAISAFLAQPQHGERTREAYLVSIRQFFEMFERVAPADVTLLHAVSFKRRLIDSGRSNATVYARISALASLFTFLGKLQFGGKPMVTTNPFTAVNRSDIKPTWRSARERAGRLPARHYVDQLLRTGMDPPRVAEKASVSRNYVWTRRKALMQAGVVVGGRFRQPPVTRTCEECGLSFVAEVGSSKKFHTKACYVAAQRRGAQIRSASLEKRCVQCGKVYRLLNKSYCSQKCQHASGRVERICEACGKHFTVPRGDEWRAKRRRFCSVACVAESTRSRVERVCEECGKRYKGAKRRRFCSVACVAESTRSRVERVCEECGKRYKGAKRRRFCSVACVAESTRSRVERVCEACGERYASRKGDTRRRFCTRACMKRRYVVAGERMAVADCARIVGCRPKAMQRRLRGLPVGSELTLWHLRPREVRGRRA